LINPPPISAGWANNSTSGPVPVWALWFQNIWNALSEAFQGNDSYVSTTNITHGGTLTVSTKVTKIGRIVTVILTYADTVSTSSTVGTTTFSLLYSPAAISVANAINATTHTSLGNGYVSTDGNLYPPTATTGASESVVITATYFTAT
jgi:hypothetical protein